MFTQRVAVLLIAAAVVFPAGARADGSASDDSGSLYPSIPLPSTIEYADESPCSGPVEKEALRIINRARRASGLPELSADLHLEWAAREHSLKMAKSREMSHSDWLSLVRSSGFQGRYEAQNVAWNQESAAEVVSDWLESAPHRRNILNPLFRYTAVGCIKSKDGSYWWTEYLGG